MFRKALEYFKHSSQAPPVESQAEIHQHQCKDGAAVGSVHPPLLTGGTELLESLQELIVCCSRAQASLFASEMLCAY